MRAIRCALSIIAFHGLLCATAVTVEGNQASAKPSKPAKASSKPAAKTPAKDTYSVPDGTPGTDSDLWLKPDTSVGGADRIEGNEAAPDLVTFTFDDGPDKNTTPAVLDALTAYDIPATFFVITQRLIGKHGEEPRKLLAREYKDGHVVGTHTVSHKHLGKATEALLTKEIDHSLRMLTRVSGRAVGLFRPPFGALSKDGAKWVAKRGLTNALWSIDTLDWQAKNAAKLRAKTVKFILDQRGGVVLMHDVKPITAEVIAGIFDDLEASNCTKLAQGKAPIIPVSIHYFLKVGKENRVIPPEVIARTDRYIKGLPSRCAARPPQAVPAAAPTASPAASPSSAAGQTGVIQVKVPR